MICVSCGQPIEAGDYRLVGIERGSWASQYAHQGNCEAEARERLMGTPSAPRASVQKILPEPEVEELSLDEAEIVSNDALPRPGLERR
jgi:hypothetical protein